MSQAPASAVPHARQAELIFSHLEELPTLPAVAVRLLQLTTTSDSDAKEVVRLIESDQSLSAKILSMARRAGSGVRSDAATIEKVVLLLGFEAVRNAVLSIKVFEVFNRQSPAAGGAFDRKEFWKHSLAVACAGQLLAEQVRWRIDPEEAFVCGLLHDVGKVALHVCLPKSFDRVVQQTNAHNACIADIERKLLGVDHTVVGRRLAMRWGFPGEIVESMWLHHHTPPALPDVIEHRRLVNLVYLADLIAREQRIGYSGNFAFSQHAPEAVAEVGLDRVVLGRVIPRLASCIEERAHLIGLDDVTSSGLYLQALSSANEELARANDSLTQTNRRLAARSQFFQALCQLTEHVRSDDSVSQVCGAAAECIRTGIGLASAIVFTHTSPEGTCYVGLADAEESGGELLCIEPGVPTAGVPEAAPPPAGGPWLTPVQPSADVVLDRYASQLGDPPYWMFPIMHGGRRIGAAVFACSQDLLSHCSAHAAELESLSAAVGLTLANVQARTSAERLSEELADINRRLQQAQSSLLRTRSLAMVGEMAAGAAHELNNPLAVISGRAQLLRDLVTDERAHQALTTIHEQAHRCSQIVSELMEFAKPQSPCARAVSLQEVLGKLRSSWLSQLHLHEEQFVIELSDELPNVRVDPDQLERVLNELIRNAFEAMSSDQAKLVINCQQDVSDRVTVAVRDNGRGMSQHVLEHAFDPFFSDRPAGRGRGMGLSRAYRLSQINDVRLWLESAPGEGTAAWLSIPTGVADETAAPA